MHSFYKVTCILNNKIYFGIHRESKWPDKDDYMGSGRALSLAIAKYGRDHFVREILYFHPNRAVVAEIEKLFVDKAFINRSDNYNLKEGGEDFGGCHSDISKAKMRAAKTGCRVKPMSERHKEAISRANTGMKRTPEQCAKMSEVKQGTVLPPRTPEHCAKISEALVGRPSCLRGESWSEARRAAQDKRKVLKKKDK